jgi:AraC-like DNA-binding protein
MNTKLNHIHNWLELAKQARWSASVLAKLCGVSVRTLERYFLRERNIHPKGWLLEQRHQQASKLLQDGLSVKEAAERLDYKHPSHLTNGLKKHCGYCPTNKTIPMRAQIP